MRIVVVGAGVVGSHVAERLSGEGHDISVVDSDPELVRHIGERMDVLAVAGDASLPSTLTSAGIDGADLLIAVTQHDTTNLIVSLMASKMGAKKNVVRVRSAELSSPGGILSKEDVGADVILNSREITLSLLERVVMNPGATDVWEFADGELLLWGYKVSSESEMVGIKLKELKSRYDNLEALIVAIHRGDEIVIPTGDDVLHASDHIYVFIRRKATGDFRRLVHPEKEDIDRLLICGASNLGVALAKRLETKVKQIYLVEPDREKAERASQELNRTMVLRADIADTDVFDEYGLDEADYFLSLADDDQTNLVNSLLVQQRGVKRVGMLAQQPQFISVLPSLDLDVVVNPRLLVVSAILRHIRKGRILTVSSIGETGAEAREYIAGKGSAIVGKPIHSLGIPRGAILGALFRKEAFMIPSGETVVEPGDRVVIFALPEAIGQMERFFARSGIFH